MTTRELYKAYVDGHSIRQLEGTENNDLLMIPLLLGCYRDIYHKHIKGTEKTSAQRKISATIRNTMRDLIGREYWGMTADAIDAFCDYMDKMTDELSWQIIGMQRAIYNYYDGWDDGVRNTIAWSVTAHSVIYTATELRKKIYVPVANQDIEVDRKRVLGKYRLLDTLAVDYSRTYDNKPDMTYSAVALEGIEQAGKEFIGRLIELVKTDLDKEI